MFDFVILWFFSKKNMYLVFIPVSSPKLLNRFRLPKWGEQVTLSFVLLMRWLLETTHPGMGGWLPVKSTMFRELELCLTQPPTSAEGKGAGDWVESPMANNLIGNGSLHSLQKDDVWGASVWRCRENSVSGEGMEVPCPFLHTLSYSPSPLI